MKTLWLRVKNKYERISIIKKTDQSEFPFIVLYTFDAVRLICGWVGGGGGIRVNTRIINSLQLNINATNGTFFMLMKPLVNAELMELVETD